MDGIKVNDVFDPVNEEENMTICNLQGPLLPGSYRSYGKALKRSFEKELNLDDCPIALKRPRGNSKSSKVCISKEPRNFPSESVKNFSHANGDLPRPRRRRKSSITQNVVDDRVAQTTEMVPIEIKPPTGDEEPQELPEWLQNEITESSLKPLDTIFEDRLLEENKRIPPARSKRFNISTTTRVTRRRTFVNSSPVPNVVTSLTKSCLPRQLVFVTWEEMYPSQREDENWKKFVVKSKKDKRRSHISKLRSMNKRLGEVFRISEETEKRLKQFWTEMTDDL
ncbi:unnamed protein product [Rodentolepis nana]|uniref:Myb-like domain-containing protein n=1 Tax=Rodentolepis nana TaxID=102285 RepID=A0A0R3TRA4_RODNA|nr:unnamed protein product [Rodentolepis nana]